MLRPSAASRWFNCPGSERGMPLYAPTTSEAADQGTFAHSIAAMSLGAGCNASQWLGVTSDCGRFAVDREMAAAVQVYLDAARSLDLFGDRLAFGVEHPAKTPDPVENGTVDYWALVGSTLHVMDYKHGAGVFVDHEHNLQTMIYGHAILVELLALGAVVESVVLHIVQPRHHAGAPWRFAAPILTADLLAWGADVLVPHAKATQAPDAPRIPSEGACRWCPAVADCPARREQARELAKHAFEKVAPPDAALLSAADVGHVLEVAPMVEAWIKSVRERAFELAKAGTPPPGFKLVDRVGNRQWIDEEAARVALRAKDVSPFETKMISPAQAEKLLGRGAKKLVDPLTTKPDIGPALVPMSDNRPARNPAAAFLPVADQLTD